MEISDSPAFQAYLRARAAFTGDIGVRTLDAWREINAATWRLARLHTEAAFHMAHELLRSSDPWHPATVFVQQLHPFVERTRVWQERVLDLLGGSQAEVAAIAETYLPAVRQAAAAIPD